MSERSAAVTLAAILVYAVSLLFVARPSAGTAELAVYAASFWHYHVYLLACLFAAVPLRVFKRDAMLLKSMSLAAFAYAYLGAPFDPLSALVVAAGFMLNTAGALSLGSDRTYYGYEIAGLPPLRVDSFPYSVTSHPMLIGNVAAYAGSLLNPQFREAWWPLACTHVALNLALIVMEAKLSFPPGIHPMDDHSRARRHKTFARLSFPIPAAIGVAIWWMGGGTSLISGLAVIAAGFLLSAALTWSYWFDAAHPVRTRTAAEG